MKARIPVQVICHYEATSASLTGIHGNTCDNLLMGNRMSNNEKGRNKSMQDWCKTAAKRTMAHTRSVKLQTLLIERVAIDTICLINTMSQGRTGKCDIGTQTSTCPMKWFAAASPRRGLYGFAGPAICATLIEWKKSTTEKKMCKPATGAHKASMGTLYCIIFVQGSTPDSSLITCVRATAGAEKRSS